MINTHRTLARTRIEPYEVPGPSAVEFNKVCWDLDPDRVVLLVHDMQNHWVDLFDDRDSLVDRVGQLVNGFRQAQLPVVFCRGERAKSRFERGLALRVWGDGLNAATVPASAVEIVPELQPEPTDYLIEKPRHSAFFSTPLEPLLHKMGRDQMVVCGVFAHHGVMVSCIDGYMRNFQMTLVADALGDYSQAEHLMALQYVAQMCGSVSTIARVRAALQPAVEDR